MIGNSSEREEEKKDKKCASGHTIGLANKPIKIFTIHLFIIEEDWKYRKKCGKINILEIINIS